jgi:GNAT superfamily N-acetyltransferase
MIRYSFYKDNMINVATDHGTAELSKMDIIPPDLEEPIFYFHRIKVMPKFEGTGEGRELMIEVCKHADMIGATIYNSLNPYGKRDMKSLKSFFTKSGFEDYKAEGPDTMIRKPRPV